MGWLLYSIYPTEGGASGATFKIRKESGFVRYGFAVREDKVEIRYL